MKRLRIVQKKGTLEVFTILSYSIDSTEGVCMNENRIILCSRQATQSIYSTKYKHYLMYLIDMT